MDVDRRDALCFASARELAGQIRARQVSAREVMTAFLSQINRLNPHLNAIVAKLDDDACLALADAADRALGSGDADRSAARLADRVQGSRSRGRISAAPRARRSSRT